MSSYAGRRVLVTGGTGFLGRHLVERLQRAGATVRVAGRNAALAPQGAEFVEADLRKASQAEAACRDMDDVFHLAAFGWGLGANIGKQAALMTENLRLNTNTLEGARLAGVERYLYTSSSSVYAKELEVLDDNVPWDREPHPSEWCFGWAKRTGELQARAYAEHHGMKIAIVRPSNPYGPYDTFDAQKSHVIPALILKAFSGIEPFPVWGSGRVVRSFVYAEDVAEGMLRALDRAANADPLNMASPQTLTIGEVARAVLDACGRKDATIQFDPTKPEGHPRKVPLTKKTEAALGWVASTPFEEGLRRTIDWYLSTKKGEKA